MKTAQDIDAEIVKRIRQLTDLTGIGSKMSIAKHKARANELSELLGWIRNSLKDESQ